jgi:hypothetical protein
LRIAKLEKALKSLRRDRHEECEDCWYSCPKSEGGCCDDSQAKDVCTCGTDLWNSIIDEALEKDNQNE